MTEQRYLEDSTVREFEATVERVVDDRVVLDVTQFYPTGGGQPHDTGTLATADGPEWDVVDVRKRDTVYHRLDGDADPPTEGAVVTGRIDWDRRYSHMRYHTAQHLLSALLLTEYGAETTGNQLYADRAHLDCAYDRFDADDLAHVESRLNDLVADARPVKWYVLDREEAEATLDPERTRLSLLPESVTDVRIVEIGGDPAREDAPPFDRTACAGTHVSNTEEIGAVTVTGRETKGRDEERIRFELDR